MGVELSCEMNKAEGFSYNWGVSFSDPKYKTPKEDNGIWKRNYGRWLLNGGVSYSVSKFNIALNASMMQIVFCKNIRFLLNLIYIQACMLLINRLKSMNFI